MKKKLMNRFLFPLSLHDMGQYLFKRRTLSILKLHQVASVTCLMTCWNHA